MAKTNFSGPVTSQNGFDGDVRTSSLNVTGTASFSTIATFMLGLPTSDPGVVGQLWNSAGTLKVSAG